MEETSTIAVTLPDGTVHRAARGTRIIDFVRKAIGARLAQAAHFAKVNGTQTDLSRPLEEDATLEVLTTKSKEALQVARHDAAHVVADAVQRLFPGTQVTIGPAIDEGFYYDFYRTENGNPVGFTPDDLTRIEALANEIVAADLPFERKEISANAAIDLFEKKGEKFKVELVKSVVERGDSVLTLYQHGSWVDFCLGPHGPSTGHIGVIKLLSSSGAYWRGDHRNPQLQRIYGTAFFGKKDLEAYLAQKEAAAARDHRKLGRELGLFYFHPTSPGAAYWTPSGTTIYNILAAAMRKWTYEAGYVEVKTPLLYHRKLWELSGHWGKYRENMFLVRDTESGEDDYSLKPMNCPSHHLYYGFEKRSHRELPLRLYTQDTLHRNEATGTLGGLTRVRQFAQDDAHIYCREDQVGDETRRFVELVNRVYRAFNLTPRARFSNRPANRLGDDALWEAAEAALKGPLDALGISYTVDEGGGAFYGPKLDFDVVDSLGREWQLGTFQVDYNAPERFDLKYVGEDNREHRPVVLHRAIYGSFERFIAILIEHYAGAFPTWLAPVQAIVVTVADRQLPYAQEVANSLNSKGFRAVVDVRSYTMQKKIADAQSQKIPYTLVVGDAEVAARTVAPRPYGKSAQPPLSLIDFEALLGKEAAIP